MATRFPPKSVSRTLLLVALITLTVASLAASAQEVRVSNVRRVFHNGEHNAFTDMIKFGDAYFLTFRSCPDGHGVSPNASVIVLSSTDLQTWKQVHRFSVPKRDTRDPHFLEFQNKLFVYSGTWYSGDAPLTGKDLEMNLHLGYGVSTANGTAWTDPFELHGTFGHYVWRAATFDGMAYLCGRRKIGHEVGPHGEPDSMESLMLESEDGHIWRRRSTFQEISGDETAFIFDAAGAITAIGRRRGNAQLLKSQPPYSTWKRTELDRFIGGPLIAKWGERTLVGGRQSTDNGPVTALYWLKNDQLYKFTTLPSGGDTSYPGMIALSPKRAVVSWYSSHERVDGKPITAIFLADLEIIVD